MTREQWLEFFNQLPPAAQDYLLDPVSGVNEDTAQTNLAYDNDAWERVMDIVWDLLAKRLDMPAFQEAIKQISGDRKPNEVERDLLLYVVLPLADLVPWDVEVRLQELGTPLALIQSIHRVSLRPVSYGAAVRRIAADAKISILSEETVRQLRDILISYIKGVRRDAQVLEILQRSQEAGGLGLESSQAERFLQAMTTFLTTTQVMSEEEYARWYQQNLLDSEQETRQAQDEAAKRQAKAGEGASSEVSAVRVHTSGNVALEEALDDAMAKIGDIKKDEYLNKRLRNLISTRLRDVRNSVQVRDALLRDEKVGGLGLLTAEAERIAGIIEEVYKQHHAAIEEFQRERIQRTMDEQKIKITERKQRESEEHAAWYRDKVQASSPEDLSAQLRSMMTRSPESGKAAAPSPSMQDVRSPLRLTGLSEELGTMNIEAFRRQSKDPKQAAAAILQKLETLKNESFENWTEGVQAWRRSPLQQQYLNLVTDSFKEGLPVAELVEKRRVQDPSLPTAEELGAIVALNSKLQI